MVREVKSGRDLTPKQVGHMLNTAPKKVVTLIETGQLIGYNAADLTDPKARSAWRVSPQAVKDFKKARTPKVKDDAGSAKGRRAVVIESHL